MIVRTFDGLQALTTPRAPAWSSSPTSVNLYGAVHTYAEIYKRQPNVRTCVDFLARNIAQLGLPVFRRVSDTDRERLIDHDLARWIGNPNPATRRYRLIEDLIGDLGIYFNAYWLKVRDVDPVTGRRAIGLVRLPPQEMAVVGALLPTAFHWTRNGRRQVFAVSEVVHFRGYNPINALVGLSPLETLRRVLAEEAAAGEHRELYWRNASRMDGVIERPLAAPKWTPTQKDSWREQWQARNADAGRTAVLEDGMTFKAASFSPKDSEYLSARKLTREECAAAYHIPLPLVGILDHATFSNIKEQHKHLYADCLGPWLEMVQAEIEGQLLIECEDQTDVYVEFNIAAKLAGSFEEQASSLSLAIGRPYMTPAEGRAMLNLPAIDDPSADELAPQQGGPAAAGPSRFPADPQAPPQTAAATARSLATVIRASWDRQRVRLARVAPDARVAAFDLDRWNRELADDLYRALEHVGRVIPSTHAALSMVAARVNSDTRLLLDLGADPFASDRKADLYV